MISVNFFYAYLITMLTASVIVFLMDRTGRRIYRAELGWAAFISVVIFHFIPVGYYIIVTLISVDLDFEILLPWTFFPTPVLARISMVFFWIWLAGTFVKGMHFILEYRELELFVRTCSQAGEAQAALLERCRADAGLQKKVGLLTSPDVLTPMVCRVRRPVIILPAGTDYGEDELRCIFFHEIMHIKRRHIILKRICCAAAAIHWINPYISGRILSMAGEWTEAQCDLLVCGKYIERGLYYRTLAEHVGRNGIENNATALCMDHNELIERMSRMEKSKARKRYGRTALVLLTSLFVLGESVTAAAAGFGIAEAHEFIYDATKVEIEERLDPDDYVEYVDTVDIDSVGIESEVTPARGSLTYFSWTMTPNITRKSPAFYKSSGDTIVIAVTTDNSSVTIAAGIVEPDNTSRYVNITGSGMHTFTLTKTGNYRFYIRNSNSVTVEADGYYK